MKRTHSIKCPGCGHRFYYGMGDEKLPFKKTTKKKKPGHGKHGHWLPGEWEWTYVYVDDDDG